MDHVKITGSGLQERDKESGGSSRERESRRRKKWGSSLRTYI
jgi:hypothetical protein